MSPRPIGPQLSPPPAARWFVPIGVTVGVIVGTVLCALLVSLLAWWKPHDVASILAIFMPMHLAWVLLAGGYVRADGSGVDARNIVFQYRFSWAQIVRFEARVNVEVLARDGSRTVLWAVQRANIASMTGARSRVDDVVDELERRRIAYHQGFVGEELPDTARPSRSTVRLARGEWVQLAVFPGAAAAGVLVSML